MRSREHEHISKSERIQRNILFRCDLKTKKKQDQGHNTKSFSSQSAAWSPVCTWCAITILMRSCGRNFIWSKCECAVYAKYAFENSCKWGPSAPANSLNLNPTFCHLIIVFFASLAHLIKKKEKNCTILSPDDFIYIR